MNLSRRNLAISLAAFIAVPKRLFAAENPLVEIGRLVVAARREMLDTPVCVNRWRDAEYCAAHKMVALRGVNGLISQDIEKAIVQNRLADGYWLEVSKRNAGLADEGSLSLRKLERALSIEHSGDWERVVVWHTSYGPIEPWMIAPFTVPSAVNVGPQLIVSAKDPRPTENKAKGWSITGGEGMDALPLSDDYIAGMVRNMRRRA
jgi:hypothetical protein